MKKIISYLLLAMVIVSCSKPNSDLPISYLGTYMDGKNDTAVVSQNGNYITIDWRRHGGLIPFVFDSVVVNADLTFTDNELVTIQSPYPYYTTFRSVGTGNFGQNTLNFNFIVQGATIIYNGVKNN